MTEIAGFVGQVLPGDPEAGAPIVLLHGMGGDQTSLLDFGSQVAPGRTLVSLRGRQRWKDGYTFFLRHPDDRLDLDDLAVQLPPLMSAIRQIGREHGTPILIGYSLGSIITAALMAAEPGLIAGAVLLRPMPPGEGYAPEGLGGLPILMIGGDHDERRKPSDFPDLHEALVAGGADVTARLLDAAHALIVPGPDTDLTRDWLGQNF